MEKRGKALKGAIFIDGAMCDNPERDVPISLLKLKTLVALAPAKELERYSRINPAFNFLLFEIPVKTSKDVVKKLDLGTSVLIPSYSPSVCVYKLLNHLTSHFPFSKSLDGV